MRLTLKAFKRISYNLRRIQSLILTYYIFVGFPHVLLIWTWGIFAKQYVPRNVHVVRIVFWLGCDIFYPCSSDSVHWCDIVSASEPKMKIMDELKEWISCEQITSHQLNEAQHITKPYSMEYSSTIQQIRGIANIIASIDYNYANNMSHTKYMEMCGVLYCGGSMGLLPDTGCVWAGNAGNIFPATDLNRLLDILACITARASSTCGDACRDR